jgi:bacillithiol biosynthesis cysteine-adding enzyme BshC
MKTHQISFKDTGYFSELICDYLEEKNELRPFYSNATSFKGFEKQIKEKSSFALAKRKVLINSLVKQHEHLELSEKTTKNIQLLIEETTFTVTTGHQLNLFTGPLYFLYKIISTLNLTQQLKKHFPSYNFVPVYWMATEDHDFDEINFFNSKDAKIQWEKDVSGGVGRLKLDGFESVIKRFESNLNSSLNAKFLMDLIKTAYLEHSNLAEATRYIVNELFSEYGLVIIDGDDVALKKEFIPIVKEELVYKSSFAKVTNTNEELKDLGYPIQVNPREINLFYLKNNLRERIVYEKNLYKVNNTNIEFSEAEILKEVAIHPERFSPNVILRPVYQETILPNLCYIGGGGELAYWLQLKAYFNAIKLPFPILKLRNSALLVNKKQLKKLKKLNIDLNEIFLKQVTLIDKRIKEISEVKIDFTEQKQFLMNQFTELKEIAKKTDYSFLGAVNAQEAKQLKGLKNLEKRLLKAQKRKLSDEVNRIKIIQDELFPKQSLEERYRNFSEYYLILGKDLIPMLIEALNPSEDYFTIIEY